MFTVLMNSIEEFDSILEILSTYKVGAQYLGLNEDGEVEYPVEIIVAKELREGDLYLAELAFEMNFHQTKSNICPSCKRKIEETGEGESTCGHLTFSGRIGA